MQRRCRGPGRTLQAAEGERGGDPAHGQGYIPPPQEASRGRQRRGHVASQPKPPWGSKEGKCFMELEKKKALPTGPGAASSSARPCVSAGTRGWPAPPSPAPGTRWGLPLWGWQGWSSGREPVLCPPRTPGSQPGSCWDEMQGQRQPAPPGAQRETEAADAVGLAASPSPWRGQAAGSSGSASPLQHRRSREKARPLSPPGPSPGL